MSPHKHAPREGLDDDGSRADTAVGQAGPPHAVLLLEHHGRPDPAQMLGQPGEGQSGGPCGQRPLSWSGTKPPPWPCLDTPNCHHPDRLQQRPRHLRVRLRTAELASSCPKSLSTKLESLTNSMSLIGPLPLLQAPLCNLGVLTDVIW